MAELGGGDCFPKAVRAQGRCESRWPGLGRAARQLSLDVPAGELCCGGINSVKRFDLLLFSRNIKSLDNGVVCFH